MTNQIQNPNDEKTVSRRGAKARDRFSCELRVASCEQNKTGPVQSTGPFGGFSPLAAFDELSRAANQTTTPELSSRNSGLRSGACPIKKRRSDPGVPVSPAAAPLSDPSLGNAGNPRPFPFRRRLTSGAGLLIHRRAPAAKGKRRAIYWTCYGAMLIWFLAVICFCAWRFR